MLYNRILNEKQRIEQELLSIEEKLKTFPPGNLFFSHSGNYTKWYQSNGHSQIYIPKKNRVFAEQLAFKKYLSLLREDLVHEKESLNSYLNTHNNYQNQAPQLLSRQSEYAEFLRPNFTPLSQELTEWKNASYEQNPTYPEQLTQPTLSGKYVRSKSEALIDMILSKHNLPFRYECVLPLGTKTFYPDFTIRHPSTGKTYYWEHFGMMDIPLYSNQACSKLQLYISHGIIPDINLITTFETKDAPLNPELVETLVQHHFL